MVDLSDFVAHSPNVKRGDIPAEQRLKLNDALEDLNPDLYGADIGKLGGGGNDIPTAGLVSYWPLDDLGDGTAADYVGTHDGTLRNGVGSAGGQQDGAASFDGTDDYIDTDWVGPSGDGTIACWIKPANPDRSDQVGQRLVTNDDGQLGWALSLADQATVGIRFFNRDGTDVIVDSNTEISAGVWQHVTGTVDTTTGERRIYIDGSPDATGTAASNGLVQNGKSVLFGRAHTGGSPYVGLLDDVRIYDRSLSDAEVKTLYNATETPRQT